MAGHHITICKECKKVISQCRCDSKDKLLIESICEECNKKEDEMVENIRKGCSCKHCHGNIADDADLGCTCTEGCKTLTKLQDWEETAMRYQSSNGNAAYEALVWLDCINIAERMHLKGKIFFYKNMVIEAYERIGYHTWSEILGFNELTEYYQKLIDLKASRPK